MAQQASLFGPDAADIDTALRNDFIKNNSDISLGGLAASAGWGIGTGVGRMMGLEHPQVRKAQIMQQVKQDLSQSGVDMSDPAKFYPELIKTLNKYGMSEEAMNAANAYRSQSLEGALKTSQITENNAKAIAAMREKMSPLGKLQAEMADAEAKGDTRRADEYRRAIKLETQGKLEKITEGVPGKEDYVREVYKDSFGNVVATGEPYKKTPMVSIDQTGEKADTLQQAQVQGKNFEEFSKSAKIASEVKPIVNNMLALVNNNKLIAGGYSQFKEAMARFVGIPLGDDPSKVADSQIYDALLQKVIIPQIRLFAPVSDYDIEALKKAYGDRKLEPEAIKKILEIALEGANKVADTNDRFRMYLRKGGRLSDWDFVTGYPAGEAPKETTPVEQPKQTTTAPKAATKTPVVPKEQYARELDAAVAQGKLTKAQKDALIYEYYTKRGY